MTLAFFFWIAWIWEFGFFLAEIVFMGDFPEVLFLDGKFLDVMSVVRDFWPKLLKDT